ncbi:dihydrodipicolinate synthase family protein [Oribacterium sp. oral taxon 102]|uniref:dihydrodipicolinate synthase family protein n=1 Tax=Oribacterium sp. oral taxon 102 TaxID=671214 RepID=UPI0015B90E0B|nr:dihydrodipicolinate synthase family protein [Oribacterium sp. oral taxon 102]NWO22248.1 dihydrodipicolinate synthase family protein [Oribacterium sp. oral taxon 102]
MNTDFIKGVVVPIITVIDGEERIDEAGMRKQVDYVIENGMHGILAFGSNGEFYELEEDEMERGLRIMAEQAAGRVPVYFGIGAINTRKCVRLAQMAVRNGAACVSVLQPMFLKPTYEELYRHFRTIAEAVPETPVLLYNNPGRVGYGLSIELVTALAHDVPNIVGMKDTSGDITLTEECVRRNRDVSFKVFGGKDTLLYASLCVGAVGGVCTAGNFMPELIGAVYERFIQGDLKGSLEAQFRLNPVRLAMDKASFPVAAKDMAALRGIPAGSPYLPSLPTVKAETLELFRSVMRDAGLL